MRWLLACSLLLFLAVAGWAKPTSVLDDLRTSKVDASAAHAEIRSVKASVFYRDFEPRAKSNWLSRALARLRNLLAHRQNSRTPMPKLPSWLGQGLNILMWSLLAAAVAAFAWFAVRHYRWQASLKRKAAMIDEDEPDRTADEWISLAEQYEASGDLRLAVRSLYLACLLRFDEARVARFDRRQTNWEHLARIQASPKKPEGFEFVTSTKAFDRIWYGQRVRGSEDVEAFRQVYLDLISRLQAEPVR